MFIHSTLFLKSVRWSTHSYCMSQLHNLFTKYILKSIWCFISTFTYTMLNVCVCTYKVYIHMYFLTCIHIYFNETRFNYLLLDAISILQTTESLAKFLTEYMLWWWWDHIFLVEQWSLKLLSCLDPFPGVDLFTFSSV